MKLLVAMMWIDIYIYIYIYIYSIYVCIYMYVYDTEQTKKLEQLYKVGSECKLNSWTDDSVGYSV